MPHVRAWCVAFAILAASAACKGSGDSPEPAHTVTPAVEEAPKEVAPAPEALPREPSIPSGVEPPTDAADEAVEAPAVQPGPAAKAPSAKQPADNPTDAPKAKAEPSAPKPAPEPEAKPDPPQPPAPAEPAKEDSKPKTTTKIASTPYVRIEVTAPMQKLLDADPRMEAWIKSTVKVADDCYASIRAKDPKTKGTIKVRVTMHKNARPTPDIQSLPSQLSSMMVCATGKLMSKRPPLFTGPEGEKHDIAIHFTP